MTVTDQKEDVRQQFGKNASGYTVSELHAKGKDLEVLVNLIEQKDNSTLLDIATGAGHTVNVLAPYVTEAVAFDLTEEMLDQARTLIQKNKHENVSFVRGDAENMPFEEETFDIVTCRIAAHHFQDLHKFLKEVRRVLKPGGAFILIDNTAPEADSFDTFYNTIEKERDYSHVRAWKKSEWIHLIEQYGLELAAAHGFKKTFHFEDWCSRMQMTEDEKQHLSSYIKNTGQDIKTKFHIIIEEDNVSSFQGEAVILKAVKAPVI
ncbi:class I SAM-dependent methyltransferase [Alkalicoccus saliphilus]|uniref:SAM-dependent methyltransferase n=1 Tax=Alkalicoccus saliphilus TaxID=200989 RepID=A0A2T4U6V0_9BACI|nr:class I SAM-dependent methyltransferase [Alkalicoccus saliphilus]PTL39130.1 SAM-dependent methyltransferase [Alkalicoccus saliphilus]